MMPSVSLSLPAMLAGQARTWVCLSCMFWPEELEAVHSHTFRVKTFKKSKHCGVCKQPLSTEGLICRVCRLTCHKKCEVKLSLVVQGEEKKNGVKVLGCQKWMKGQCSSVLCRSVHQRRNQSPLPPPPVSPTVPNTCHRFDLWDGPAVLPCGWCPGREGKSLRLSSLPFNIPPSAFARPPPREDRPVSVQLHTPA